MIELPIESSTVRLPRMLKLTVCLLVAMMPQANGYMSMCDMMEYDEYGLFFHEKESFSMKNTSTQLPRERISEKAFEFASRFILFHSYAHLLHV